MTEGEGRISELRNIAAPSLTSLSLLQCLNSNESFDADAVIATVCSNVQESRSAILSSRFGKASASESIPTL